MVVLNFYGKIPTICISKKLGLYISNLPNEAPDDWKDYLIEQLKIAIDSEHILRRSTEREQLSGIQRLYHQLFPQEEMPALFNHECIEKVADQMIRIYQDYDYDDMPLGGWDTNCFDSRLCEEDYSEKIIDLINYLSYRGRGEPPSLWPTPVPQWTYSSNHDGVNSCRIFFGGRTC